MKANLLFDASPGQGRQRLASLIGSAGWESTVPSIPDQYSCPRPDGSLSRSPGGHLESWQPPFSHLSGGKGGWLSYPKTQ